MCIAAAAATAAAAKSLQSCPTLCDPIDGLDTWNVPSATRKLKFFVLFNSFK